MWFTSRKTEMPSPEAALAGRDRKMPVPDAHFVNGNRLEPPFPDELEVAMFGMGCFWGAERKFWELKGVWSTSVGYAGGHTPNPTYEEVCTGLTGHNEVVRVVFDPETVDYCELLRCFWESHDPTQGMRQGNDVGTQYRSGIYAVSDAQQAAAAASRDAFRKTPRRVGIRAHHDRDRRGAGVLLRRGLPPAVPREESVGVLRDWRDRRLVPGRRRRGLTGSGRVRLRGGTGARSHARRRRGRGGSRVFLPWTGY